MKNFKAKKSLGQNFLKSKAALASIVTAGEIHEGDIVLEIGPGKGVLTEKLLSVAGKVIAIEKDRELVAMLQEKFATEITDKKLDIIEGDILKFDPHVLSFYSHFPYKIIANIPYYITGAILKHFLESTNKPECMVLLVQKEVADRIVARDGKESILSLSVKAFGTPKYIEKVPKKYFSPAPKVDSAIIAIRNIGDGLGNMVSSDKFMELVKAGFAHKRKFLIKNLENYFKLKAENRIIEESRHGYSVDIVGNEERDHEIGLRTLEEAFSKLEISPSVRGEDVPFVKWIELAKILIH